MKARFLLLFVFVIVVRAAWVGAPLWPMSANSKKAYAWKVREGVKLTRE
jgi:hypothetical protein